MRRPARTVRVLLMASLATTAAVLIAGSAGAEPGFSSADAMPQVPGAGTAGNAYGAVSCDSMTSCTAVGPWQVVEGESASGSGRGTWSSAPHADRLVHADPRLARALAPFLASHRNPSAPSAVIEGGSPSFVSESGGAWGVAGTVTLPVGAQVGQISGVSCTATGDCEAVGYFESDGGENFPMMLTESGGVWSALSIPDLPANAATGVDENAAMEGVDCVSTGNCVAVGGYDDTSGILHGLVEVQTAGSAFVPEKLPDIAGLSDQSFAVPLTVSCSDLADCTTVGLWVTQTALGETTRAWTEVSGTWSSSTKITSPPNATFVAESVACPDPSTCIAVGGALSDLDLPAYAVETSGSWGEAQVLPFPRLSPAAAEGVLSSISCDTDALCEAVGYFQSHATNSSDVTGGAATWSNGTWSSIGYVRGVRVGSKAATVSALVGVACPSTTQCTAVGAASASGAASLYRLHPFSTVLEAVRAVTDPSAPTTLRGTGEPGSLHATWLSPLDDGGSPITDFHAHTEPGGHGCVTGSDGCSIGGLLNGHRYRLIVTATSAKGTSAEAVDASAVLVGRVPTRPAGVRVRVRGGDLSVAWHASRTVPGEPIHAYLVTVHGPDGFARRASTRHLEVLFSGAGHAGTYVVAIIASNASGRSKPSRTTVHAAAIG